MAPHASGRQPTEGRSVPGGLATVCGVWRFFVVAAAKKDKMNQATTA
jgi:hypothetical protein